MSSLHESLRVNAAVQLAELGYRVFPGCPGKKYPLTEHGFKDASSDEDQIGEWWKRWPDANIGLTTAGLLVIDVDTIDGKPNPWLTQDRFDMLYDACGGYQKTPSGGHHFIFRQPDGADLRNSTGKIASDIDTRANGGYVIVAPSNTEAGSYEWVKELDKALDDLHEPPEWLLELLTTSKSTRSSEVPATAATSIGISIPDGQRNCTLASMAGSMRRCGMGSEAIQAALTVTNEKQCKPPLDSTEVKRIAKSIARYEPAANGVTCVLSTPLVPTSITSLVQQFPTLREPVIEGLLRRGESLNVVASTKAGKSWLSYGIGLAVATGGYAFGKLKCTPGRVLIIDNELHPETLASRMQAVCEAMGLSVADVSDRLDIIALRGQLVDINGLWTTIRAIEASNYSLIILDALYRLIPAGVSENDNAGVTGIYNTIDRYASMSGAAIMCIHHASKGDQSGKAITDVGSGAGAQSRAADSHLILRPHVEDNVAVCDAAVRSWKKIEPFCLRWEFPLWVSADDSDPRVIKRSKTKADQQQETKDAESCRKIIEFLRQHRRGTASQFRKWVGSGPERVNRLISIMEADGRLIGTASTVNGNSCRVYSLPDDLDPEEGGVRGLSDNPADNQTTPLPQPGERFG